MKNELFDEKWKNILYHICMKDFYLKSRSAGISRLLNLIREYIRSNSDKVTASLMILKLKTQKERVEFMNHLKKYGFDVKERMKSPDAVCSTIYSIMKLKNPTDAIE